jgi:hypothetical protein
MRRVAPILLALSLVGPLALTPGSPAAAAADGPEATVRRYANALLDGRVEEAHALRCRGIRVPKDQRRLFASQADDVLDALGRVRAIEVERIRPTGVGPRSHHSAARAYVRYRVVTADGATPPVRAVLVKPGEEWLLCGTSAPDPGRACRAAVSGLRTGPPLRTPPRQLLEIDPGPEYRVVETAPVTTRRTLAYLSGWTRVWQRGSFGGDRVTVREFTTPPRALADTQAAIDNVCGASVAVFGVPGLPGAVGVRLRTYDWIALPTPQGGPFVEQVYLARGDLALYAAASPVPAGEGHGRVERLARLLTSEPI